MPLCVILIADLDEMTYLPIQLPSQQTNKSITNYNEKHINFIIDRICFSNENGFRMNENTSAKNIFISEIFHMRNFMHCQSKKLLINI